MRKIEIIILAVSLFFSFAAGWMVSDWFNSPLTPEGGICPPLNYAEIKRIVEEALKKAPPSGAGGLFDVDKIKNVRGFTYAPQSVYQVELCRDTLLLRQVMEQMQPPNPQRGNKKIRK